MKKRNDNNDELSFGFTEFQKDFLEEYQQFILEVSSFPDLIELLFKETGVEDLHRSVIIVLARQALDSFNEIFLLCSNGLGVGGLKILRGMYERVVTLKYLADNPDKLDAFLEYTYVHRHKLIQHLTDEEINKYFSKEQVEEIKKQYQAVRDNYLMVTCNKCKKKRVSQSWTKMTLKNMAAQVKLGDQYILAHFHPTLFLHTTEVGLSHSTKQVSPGIAEYSKDYQKKEVGNTLQISHLLVIHVLDTLNEHFYGDKYEPELIKMVKRFGVLWQC